jgi:hypothetical protein
MGLPWPAALDGWHIVRQRLCSCRTYSEKKETAKVVQWKLVAEARSCRAGVCLGSAKAKNLDRDGCVGTAGAGNDQL